MPSRISFHTHGGVSMDLSFKVTSELAEALQKLDNEYTKAYAALKAASPEELQSLHKYARVSMIGASTRIENAQLTDPEVNWLDTILTEDGKPTAFEQHRLLIEDKLSKDRERSIEEVAGCRAMLMEIYENPHDFFPLKESDLRALHYVLMSPYKKSIPYAGQYKTQSNSVVEKNNATGQSRVVFETADAGPITTAAMSNLVSWYNAVFPHSSWPLAVTSELVYRFLAIHPFQDGNGRLSRGLFLLSLLHSKAETISFVSRYTAVDRCIEKHKEEYYIVFNKCSNGKFKQDENEYKIQYFLKFMIKILRESLQGISLSQNKLLAEQGLSESSVRILRCFREHPEIRLTTAQLIKQTHLPRRTTVYSLNALLAASLIQKYGRGASVRYQLTF